MNVEQRKYIADIFKIVAVAQFGLFGYTGLTEHIPVFLVGSGALFAMFVYLGIYALDGEHDE